jgi:cytochrome oxidase Cu insertion factor (SCO1/SenC/PrrC family)
MPRTVDTLIAELLAHPVTGAELRQDAPHTSGLSTADAERVRAHLLASFEGRAGPGERRIPADVRAIVAEELRTSASPTVLAGAARAVRGLGADAGTDAAVDWAPLLQDAADRVATADVYVRWVPGAVAPAWMRSARGELLETLAEVNARTSGAASGTSGAAGAPGAPGVVLDLDAAMLDGGELGGVRLEDQAGVTSTLDGLLRGQTTVLAFFYTRCMNPARCSLTITRLGALARSGDERSVVAITYDPAYDSPERMRRYGADRGFPFGERSRLVRATEGWQNVRATFGLRVGYGPVTVNEHARELFEVGPDLTARPLHPDSIALGDPVGQWVTSR